MISNRLLLSFILTTFFSEAFVCAQVNDVTKQDVSKDIVYSIKKTALDRYIAKPDKAFHYTLKRSDRLPGLTVQVLDFTSQSWRSENEVNHTIWRHWLTIIRPDQVDYKTALLFITGGSNLDNAPTQYDANLLKIAALTHSVVVELRMVPNQPLMFHDDHELRKEDAIIAYTWNKYLQGGDDEWPARLPMTKSAVRAMDAVTEFCKSKKGGLLDIKNFVVSGASKRGWTTWTTAVVDPRVVAIIPLVIDVLNIDKFSDHLYRAYGFWSPADAVYTNIGIHDLVDTPKYRELMQIEEPYEYRERLRIPKFIINSAGDQYYPPDSSQFYWNDLKGLKYLRYVPNTDHSLRGSDAYDSLLCFYLSFIRGDTIPSYTWNFEKNGTISVLTKTKPDNVVVWYATNPSTRDFRLMKIGAAYKSLPAIKTNDGCYVGIVPNPVTGWTAFFVELTWNMPTGAKLKMTTSVRVIPDKLPFDSYIKKPVKQNSN